MKIPSYRKHSSGQARVTIHGRCFYLGPYGSAQSKKAYNRLIAEYLASGCQVSFGTPASSLCVSELIAEYISYAKKYYGTGVNSEYHRIRYALRVVRRLYGDFSASEFSGLQYKACREIFSNEPIKTKTPKSTPEGKIPSKISSKPRLRSRQYVNANMRRILRFFKWCASEGRFPTNNYEAMRLIPGLRAGKCSLPEAKKIMPVEEAVIEATLPHLPKMVADMVKLQRLLGCRPSELCGLKPVYINRSNTVWEVKLSLHKTAHKGRERVIYVGPKAQELLLPYLLRDSHSFCFSPSEGERNRRRFLHEKRVTPLNQGNKPSKPKQNCKRRAGMQYSVHSYARAITRAAEKAGVAHWAPNQLRHSAATDIRRQFGIEAAQVILGHAQLGVTQVYAEKDRALAIQVAQAVG